MKRVCVILADGFEEVEGITPVDYLRRVGIEVLTAGLAGRKATGSHGIVVETEEWLAEAKGDFDAVVVPGGGRGAAAIAASAEAAEFIKRHFAAGKLVAAICAAPALVLHGSCGILSGRRFTCYPGMEAQVTGATFVAERVVVDGNVITARAAACSGEFAYAIVNYLAGETAADELAEKVLLF